MGLAPAGPRGAAARADRPRADGPRTAAARADGPRSADTGDLDLRAVERLPAQRLPVRALSPELRLRRGGVDTAHVQLLADVSGHAPLPPILVRRNGWGVIDGLHRLEAAKLRGDRDIAARFVECSDAEALVLAMRANSAHGLPLSRADRLAGAERVLTAHPDWSDRAIAGISGLSGKTVAALRGRTAGEAAADGKRLGADGRLRSVVSGEGRRRAAAYLQAHPDATLREVARETDVSVGTVHDVRTRLRRGISPERDGGRGPSGSRPAGGPAGPHPGADGAGAGDGTGEGDGAADAARTGGAAPGVHAVPDPDGAPGTDGAQARCRSHPDMPLAWAAVSAKVANDPCVRYTEGGKEFLQWMALHASDPDRWQELIGAVPAHWLGVIAPIAESISKEWGQFAERLRSRQEAV
ncbi:putative ParB domain protein nuclease [Actinacidiphila reveromycinica]|uniref:Putative ParB domain protein nuclease n=1 Tax=Actinacidiphila reveromycinica TaxID=659352 RepID=A0A7U3VMA6_9ACTN|nr:putative ParB domain protein nuclease [Streptomyces sp. SN-593]